MPTVQVQPDGSSLRAWRPACWLAPPPPRPLQVRGKESDRALQRVRLYVDDAAQAGQKVSTHRLVFGLPPALATGMAHISEEIWAREAVAIGQRQQMRERGMGMSA